MSKTFTGGCLCKKVRWTLQADEMPGVALCHCLNCQKSTGSAFSISALVPEDKIKVEGELKEYTYKGGTGQIVCMHHCGECGTTVFSSTPNRPGIRVLKVGTFDDEFKPELPDAVKMEIFCARRLPFIEPGKGEPARFDGYPLQKK